MADEGERKGAAGGSTPARPSTTAPGKQLFADSCGSCHTLQAAGSSGTVGPNLDQTRPSKARVLNAIAAGGAGSGTMPKDLVTGAEAQQVADFVSKNAGK